MFGSKRGNDKSKQTITTSSSSSNGTQSACVIVSGTVIEGDFYSAVGLPLVKLYLALKEFGVDMLKH